MSRPDTSGTKNPEIVTRAAQTREAFGGTLAAGGGWLSSPPRVGMRVRSGPRAVSVWTLPRQPCETLPFVDARSLTSRSRRTASIAPSRSTHSCLRRSGSDSSSSSSCFGSMPKSTRAAISNDSEPEPPSGSSISSPTASTSSTEQRERSLAVGPGRVLVLVVDRLDLAGQELAPGRQLAQAEAVVALDDDVHPPVVEHLQHLDDRRAGPDLAPALLVFEHEPELVAASQALSDQLLVARLEDVERHALRRQENELEREESDLGHGTTKPSRPAGGHPPRAAPSLESGDARQAARFPAIPFSSALRGLVPYEPGKPVEEVQRELGLERVRQARLERGAVRAVPGGARGDRAVDGGAEPLPGRRRLPAARGARRAARRRLRGGDHRRRCGRAHRLPVPDLPRSRRRDRLRLAVVRELRHRRAQARRDAPPRAAARPPLRPRGDARGDRPAHEARLPLPPEQPDRNDEHARRGRRVVRARARARRRPWSTRRTSSTSTARTTSTRWPSYFAQGRNVVVLRTFSKIYGLAGLRVGYAVAPGAGGDRAVEGAARIRRRHTRAGGRAREPRRPRRS